MKMKKLLSILVVLNFATFTTFQVAGCQTNNKILTSTLMKDFNTTFIDASTPDNIIRQHITDYLVQKTGIPVSVVNTDKGFWYGVENRELDKLQLYCVAANPSFDFKYVGSWTKEIIAIDVASDPIILENGQQEQLTIRNYSNLINLKIQIADPKLICATLSKTGQLTIVANNDDDTGTTTVKLYADNAMTIKISVTVEKKDIS